MSAPATASSNLDLVLDVPVKLTVELGSCLLPMREVLQLGVGSVVQLDKVADDPVQLSVNRKMVARGEVVIVENRFGIKITELIERSAQAMISLSQLLFRGWTGGLVPLLVALPSAALADPANTLTLRTELPDAGLSAIRTLAALVIVLCLFFGGVWVYRNSQRLAWRKSGLPKLAILESRPLGNRYALHVVGYEQQRLLIGSSPAGLSLLSQLPPAAAAPPEAVAAAPAPASFTLCFQQLFKARLGSKTEGTGS